MRVKLFLVTYNNPGDLDLTLRSLFASDWTGHDVTVTVLNNHSRFELRRWYARRVQVIHNAGRPDFSTGHLARSWNQCLLHGFVNLLRPAADVVVTAQNDTLFDPRWCHRLAELHRQYSFITAGVGDNFCSYRPEAVRAIGLWDERFCGIGYQEADYFLRAFLHNHAGSSVNDIPHGRVHNPVPDPPLARRLHPAGVIDDHHRASMAHHALCRNLFYRKWPGFHPEQWGRFLTGPRPGVASRVENHILYPYFERDVDGLAEKNYFCDTAGAAAFDPAANNLLPAGG